ncbi:MAG TPA: glycosyltransferase family 2 protein [Actinomycetales bacterium]|nr:glycosyltransferase family 2 protein [Actinomycetales bacterium]
MTTTASQNGNGTETQRTGATATMALPKADASAQTGMVSLVIPTKNEARNLPWVLGQVPDCVDEVVLVDASVDATRTMARACRPDVMLVEQSGPGKGNALRAGFAACSGDLIVMMDADGSMSPTEIPHFVHFLKNGYDYVKGSRFMGGGGSLDITRLRHAGNWGLLMMVNLLYHANLTDLCYGYCAFDRRFLEHLDLTADGFDIEAQMTIHALKAGLRIAEVPSLELPRRSGRSNLHAFSDGRTVLRTILNDRRSNPFVFQAIQSIGAAPNEAGLADHL